MKEILSVLSGIENTDRVVKYCIPYTYRLQVVVELNGPIFWETESIRIDSSCESNRSDSNCELECTSSRRTGSLPWFPGSTIISRRRLRYADGRRPQKSLQTALLQCTPSTNDAYLGNYNMQS